MLRVRNLVLLVVAVFAVGAVAQFPAKKAIDWFAPETVQIAGIDGSVWRGGATRFALGNNVVEDVQWKFLPSRLLSGRPAYRLTGQYRNLPVAGVVKPRKGGVILEDFATNVTIASLSALAPVAGLDGAISVQLDQAVIADGWAERLAGEIRLERFESALISGSLGDYRVVFPGTSDSPLVGQIEDLGGPLKVTGQLNLSERERYSLTLDVDARSSAPAAMRQFLDFMPEAPGGGRRIEQSGNVAPLNIN